MPRYFSTDARARDGNYSLARLLAAFCAGAAIAVVSLASRADEGGVSFWLPGNFGSFAALPTEPGWTLPLIYYHTSLDAGGGLELKRGGRITAGLDATADAIFVAPTYTFASPVAGGQASLGVAFAGMHMKDNINATLTGPRGNVISGSESDTLTAGSDLYPLFTLKWNRGVHNFMAYTSADVPIGSYQTGRLANVGINHWAEQFRDRKAIR